MLKYIYMYVLITQLGRSRGHIFHNDYEEQISEGCPSILEELCSSLKVSHLHANGYGCTAILRHNGNN